MVDQDDMLLNVCINYNNNQIIFDRTNDLPSIDELKNKIMKKLEIPNTKDYLYLSKGSVQNIGEEENLFNYAKEKEYSHQKEYILELDLRISDEVDKFKKILNGDIDENKYNEQKIELDKIVKEYEKVKNKIKEMEKSKREELENLIKKINEMKEKIIIKEREKKNELQIKLLKKELEDNKFKNHINELLNKIREKINLFFKDKTQILEKEYKKIEDERKNKDNDAKKIIAEILKYINDWKEVMKEFNEIKIKLSKSTSQQTKEDSEKEKSLIKSNKKDSFQIDIKLMGEKNKKYEDINNNKQKIENDINGPQDNPRNIKNIEQKKNININDDDVFYNFLNEIYFKKRLNDLENEWNIFISKLKSPKEISIKKFNNFYDQKILPILEDNNDKDVLKKKDFRDKKKMILEILKNFGKKHKEIKKTNKDNNNISQNLIKNNYLLNNTGKNYELKKNEINNNKGNIYGNANINYFNNVDSNPSYNTQYFNNSNSNSYKRHSSMNYNDNNIYKGFYNNTAINYSNNINTGIFQKNSNTYYH